MGESRREGTAVERLFVAVVPDEPVLDRLASLPRDDVSGVRWTPRHQWHVTVRFLGDAERAEAIEALTSVVAAPRVVTLGPCVERLGPSVVCVPVAGLDDLAEVVGTAMRGIGSASDDRPFRGHLTLGRAARRSSIPLVGTPFEAAFDADELVLVRSSLGAGPVRHEVVGRRALTR